MYQYLVDARARHIVNPIHGTEAKVTGFRESRWVGSDLLHSILILYTAHAWEERLVMVLRPYLATSCHHGDTGGIVPGHSANLLMRSLYCPTTKPHIFWASHSGICNPHPSQKAQVEVLESIILAIEETKLVPWVLSDVELT